MESNGSGCLTRMLASFKLFRELSYSELGVYLWYSRTHTPTSQTPASKEAVLYPIIPTNSIEEIFGQYVGHSWYISYRNLLFSQK